MPSADFPHWQRDEAALADLGRELFSQPLRVAVRLPAALARHAVEAWERDDNASVPEAESEEQARIRTRAGTFALIGLSVSERGTWEGDEVAVELDAWFIGTSLDAAEDHGLLDTQDSPQV